MANYSLEITINYFYEIPVKVLYNGLNYHVHSNNILFPRNCGFRKGSCTEDVTFVLIYNVLGAINQEVHVGGISCDLAKGFDCVNPEVVSCYRTVH
jgi:hypothetical protein